MIRCSEMEPRSVHVKTHSTDSYVVGSDTLRSSALEKTSSILTQTKYCLILIHFSEYQFEGDTVDCAYECGHLLDFIIVIFRICVIVIRMIQRLHSICFAYSLYGSIIKEGS